MSKMRTFIGAGLVGLASLLSNPAVAQNQSVVPQLTVAGQLQRWTGMTLGGKHVGTTAIVDASGNQITAFATATKQSDGSHKTQIVDGSGNVIAATSNNLNVQCANCSGSGVSTADAASFTASTSLFAGTGGFFQTTATSNALTNGQQGMWQMTAHRAGFVNLRNASGAELGVAAAPLQVSLANTAANAAAVKVDGSAVTQPVSGTVTANLGTIGGAATETTLSALNTKTPALGQALAAASVPVILPAATITTLTPPAAITGFATAVKQPALGTAGSAASDVLTVQGVASMTPIAGNITQVLGASISASNPVPSSPAAAATGGATPSFVVAANSNNSTSLKGSAGVVYGIQVSNINASTAYFIKLYDKATAPTCGTDTPVAAYVIPPSNGGNNVVLPVGKTFTLGIGYCIVAGIANNDNTSVPAATILANIDWK